MTSDNLDKQKSSQDLQLKEDVCGLSPYAHHGRREELEGQSAAGIKAEETVKRG